MTDHIGFDPDLETINREMILRAEGALIACVCIGIASALLALVIFGV